MQNDAQMIQNDAQMMQKDAQRCKMMHKWRPSSTAGDFVSPSYGRKITNFGAGRNSGSIFRDFTAFFRIFTAVFTAGFASQALITARCIFAGRSHGQGLLCRPCSGPTKLKIDRNLESEIFYCRP